MPTPSRSEGETFAAPHIDWRQRTGIALSVSIFPLWWKLACKRYSSQVIISLGPLTVIATLYRPN